MQDTEHPEDRQCTLGLDHRKLVHGTLRTLVTQNKALKGHMGPGHRTLEHKGLTGHGSKATESREVLVLCRERGVMRQNSWKKALLTLDKSPPLSGLLPPQGGGVELDQVTLGHLALSHV